MTQTPETLPTAKALFNIIVAENHLVVDAIAQHYGLTDVRRLEDVLIKLRLSTPGREYGDKLNEFLNSLDHTVTLVITADDAWIQALLNNNLSLAPMVWRSIESKLMGHRTDSQRNLLVVATSALKGGDVRKAIEKGNLLALTNGVKVPSEWRTPRPEAPKKEKPAKGKAAVGEYVEKNLKPRTDAKKAGASPQQLARLKSAINPGSSAVSKAKGPRPKGNVNGLREDLYLLCKGHYGEFNVQAVINKGKFLIRHHNGLPENSDVGLGLLIPQLFETLTRSSSRGFWGGYNLLKEVVYSGAEGPDKLLGTLIGHIGTIPAVDGDGEPIKQPQANAKLRETLIAFDDKTGPLFDARGGGVMKVGVAKVGETA